jgi:NIPSNAP protein
MLHKYGVMAGVLVLTFVAGISVGQARRVQAAGKNRVLEIRTYTTHEGRLPALVDRMGHGEGKVFERLGMKPVGFFVAAEAPKSQNTFVYILSHESVDKAKENWAKFREDSEWKEIRQRSESAGPIVAKAEAVFVDPTSFSPLK